MDTRGITDRLVPSQIQQIWSRLIFAVGGLTYLLLHGDFIDRYETIFIISAAFYFLYNIIALLSIRSTPLSAFRMLFGPLLDAWVVSLGMMVDGGQSSGLYLVFFVIIFGNALRFGNSMLLYSQAVSIAGIISVSVSTLFGLNIDLDGTLLTMQCIALIAVPVYALQIKKQAYEALLAKQKAEEATFGLLDHGLLPAFTFHLDNEGLPRILYANLAMQKVYRDSSVSLIGEQVDILALMEDGDEIIRACQYVFSEKGKHDPYRFYIRGRDAADCLIQLMGQCMRLHWHGKWVGVCFLLDITRTETVRSELEHSLQSSHMNTLVSGIVHDFRNILTSIIGTSEVMNFGTDDENIKKQLQLIMDAGERGSNIISHLLTLGKTEYTTPKTSTSYETIHNSLTSILGLMRIQLPAHIQLHLKMDDQLPDIAANITYIEQIVTNLINNATQAIEKSGHITVSLRAASDETPQGAPKRGVLISVTDNGKGIPESDIHNVIKPFWTSRRDSGGTGLGLATVQQIVRINNGSMNIDSIEEKGTTVDIFLPSRPDSVHATGSESAKHPQAVSGELAGANLTPEPTTILLVDDNPEVLFVHEAQLEKMGHTLYTAEDGEAALDLFKAHSESIRMVVSDYKMPKMDGLALSIAIREINPDMPILIITAYGEIEKMKQTKEMGIHILAKPATYKKLANTIASIQRPVVV